MTRVQRKSLCTKIRQIDDGPARQATRAIVTALHLSRARVETLICDICSEFAEHERVDIMPKAQSYFADHYSAWQRGTNENSIGMLGPYLPKGKSMIEMTDKQIQRIEATLNDEPRRTLGFRAPSETFFASFNRCAS